MKYCDLSFLAAGLIAVAAHAAPAVEIVIDTEHPGPVIGKHLHGQSAGHPGDGYGGRWVGPDSPIANLKGWRKDAVAALKELRVPLLSWPEGCQADAYDWRDGIGPRAQRPRRDQRHLGAGVDDNAVGTHEFFDLAELTGADAQVNGNVGTGSAREAAQWIEYLIADGGSSLARLRAANGRAQPFKPAYFGVGAAPWGCGGNMTPEYYADLYNQYAVFIKGKGEQGPALVASGAGPDWTGELSAKKRIRDYRFAIGAHDPGPRQAPGGAPWAASLQGMRELDAAIGGHLASLDRNDSARKIGLGIDTWQDGRGPATAQSGSLGEALLAALRLHVLHAHAQRLQRATQQSALFLAEGERLVLTPTYHVFKLHAPFQGAASLPVRIAGKPRHSADLAGVSASAARAPDGKLYLSLVNTVPGKPVAVALRLAGARARTAHGSVLSGGSLDARNSPASPQAVRPAPVRPLAGSDGLRLHLPAGSLTVLELAE